MIAEVEPAIKPGLNAIVVPVYEISITVPFVTDSKSRRRETSKSTINVSWFFGGTHLSVLARGDLLGFSRL